jgi:hypothetical protein
MSRGRLLCILDSATAARAMLAAGPPGGEVEIISTHHAVVDHLAARGIACHDCSEFISPEQVRSALADASRSLETVLGRLDETLAARMCATAGLPRMAVFNACFKYLGRYNLAGLASFERILDARLAGGDIAAVHFFYARPDSNDPVFSFVRGAQRVCRDRGVDCRPFPVRRTRAARMRGGVRRTVTRAMRVLQAPQRLLGRPLRGLRRWRPGFGSGAAPPVILLNAAAESFFRDALAVCGPPLIELQRARLAPRDPAVTRAARGMLERMRSEAAGWLRKEPAEEAGYARALVTHLLDSAHSYLLPVLHVQLALQSCTVAAAAWDIPPASEPALNVLTELFLRSGVPVLGRQHGASYVDQDLGSIHFDSDFNRCTHYFSYGFGPQEFAATYPMARAPCAFIPAGNAPPRARRRRCVDVAFPLAYCSPLFYLARMPEHELAQRQARILESLETRTDLSCVVKPPLHYSEDNIVHAEALRRLRHVRIAHGTWTEYLSRWQPRLVVLEIASTPLFEVLPLDVDVFLMLDPLFPFSTAALAMLRERVHVYATTTELTEAIRLYGREPAAHLRDQTFYNTYVNRGSIGAVPELLGRLAFRQACAVAAP